MYRILKLKHWQVFIPLMIIIILFILFSNLKLHDGSPLSQVFKLLFGILGVVYIFVWILSIGLAMNNIQEDKFKSSKVLLVSCSIICILGYTQLHLEDFEHFRIVIPASIKFLTTFLTFFSLMYILRTVSKSIISFEKGGEAIFMDYLLIAIVLFAMPIGVWIIQPKLNKIYQQINS